MVPKWLLRFNSNFKCRMTTINDDNSINPFWGKLDRFDVTKKNLSDDSGNTWFDFGCGQLFFRSIIWPETESALLQRSSFNLSLSLWLADVTSHVTTVNSESQELFLSQKIVANCQSTSECFLFFFLVCFDQFFPYLSQASFLKSRFWLQRAGLEIEILKILIWEPGCRCGSKCRLTKDQSLWNRKVVGSNPENLFLLKAPSKITFVKLSCDSP